MGATTGGRRGSDGPPTFYVAFCGVTDCAKLGIYFLNFFLKKGKKERAWLRAWPTVNRRRSFVNRVTDWWWWLHAGRDSSNVAYTRELTGTGGWVSLQNTACIKLLATLRRRSARSCNSPAGIATNWLPSTFNSLNLLHNIHSPWASCSHACLRVYPFCPLSPPVAILKEGVPKIIINDKMNLLF